jgi:hypothetical protein
VRCGKCRACKRTKKLHWTSRILQETLYQNQQGNGSYFVTFTYDKDHVPHSERGLLTLRKRRVQKWINSLHNSDFDFRYYFVGEYGEKLGRPHLHAAIWSTPDTVERIAKAWANGVTQIKGLHGPRMAYLAKYTTKKLITKPGFLPRDIEPEFRLSSRTPPLGADFARMVAARYSSPGARKIIEREGDVQRFYKLAGRRYPLGDYSLKIIRTELGIPVLDRERELANPDYRKYFPQVDAEKDELKHLAQVMRFRREEASKLQINQRF